MSKELFGRADRGIVVDTEIKRSLAAAREERTDAPTTPMTD